MSSLKESIQESMRAAERQARIETAQKACDIAASVKDGHTLWEIAQFLDDSNLQDILKEVYWRPGAMPRKRMTSEQKQEIMKVIYARVQQANGQPVTTSDLASEFEKDFGVTRATLGQFINQMTQAGYLRLSKEDTNGKSYNYFLGSKQPE